MIWWQESMPERVLTTGGETPGWTVVPYADTASTVLLPSLLGQHFPESRGSHRRRRESGVLGRVGRAERPGHR